jgi:hypothetical protein
MSGRLENAEYDLMSRIGPTSDDYDYLRSASLKYRYAEKRLISLRRKIANYKRKVEVWDGGSVIRFPDALPIEMDLDHCIASLRSSIEHLAQLINSVVKLGLKPVGYGKGIVSPQTVVDAINSSTGLKRDKYLSRLSSFLGNEIHKDWYKELHRFRIEMYHHKSREILDHASVGPSLVPNWMDELFVIPLDVAISAKTRRDREVCNFCQNKLNDVENVLYNSFYLLSKYLP